MTLLWILVVLAIAGFIMYAANRHLPYPWSLVTVAVVILILVLVLLNFTGMLGSMNRPILGPG